MNALFTEPFLVSLLFGAVKRSDVEMLLASFRKPAPIPMPTGDGAGSPTSTISALVDSSSDRAR